LACSSISLVKETLRHTTIVSLNAVTAVGAPATADPVVAGAVVPNRRARLLARRDPRRKCGAG